MTFKANNNQNYQEDERKLDQLHKSMNLNEYYVASTYLSNEEWGYLTKDIKLNKKNNDTDIQKE